MQYFKFLIIIALGCTSLLYSSCNSNNLIDAESVIQLSKGKVSGTDGTNKSITVFKGIPYAKPPVGELRWQAPQAPTPWKGVLLANQFCSSCIQKESRENLPWSKEYMYGNNTDENCLALNIWTPAANDKEKLPVSVYIHGGAYTSGSGEVLLYNGESIAAKGIVVVTINYRLGIMGFFAHPELTAESPHKSSGNYGLLDQVAALKWVQQNVSAFGGDPNNVTISGQSAGAHAVHVLTASPLAKGLFHKAIAQSGPFSNGTTASLNKYEKKGVSFADTLGKTTIAELRSMPASELLAKSKQYNFRFGPNIDSWLLPNTIKNIYLNGLQNDVPMLSGINADESSAKPNYGKLQKDEFTAFAMKNFGSGYEEFLRLYPTNTKEEVKTSQIQQKRDQGLANMFNWSSIREQTCKNKSYKYYFERATPWPEHPEFQTFHSSEIPYVFGNQILIDRPWEQIDYELSDLMMDYWVNFMKTGNPNSNDLPEWSSEKDKMMRFGKSSKSDIILDIEKLKFYQIPQVK